MGKPVLPEMVILDTKEIVKQFDDFIKTLPESFNHTTEGCVFGVCHYLVNENESRGDVCDYLFDLREELKTGQHPANLIDQFCAKMHDLAQDIWRELVTNKVYTPSGINWYLPHSLVGSDLVLELTPDTEAVEEDLQGVVV